jgi:hypothetical protein
MASVRSHDPTQGTDEVSVMRASCMSPSACKQRAKSIERAPRKLYRGLAVLNAGAVRSENMAVSDSRIEFCGHAHISTGVVTRKRERDEPRDPSEVERVKAVAQKLIRLSRFYADQFPEAPDWPERDAPYSACYMKRVGLTVGSHTRTGNGFRSEQNGLKY